MSPKTTFHSFRHSIETQLRNGDADAYRSEWIDIVLGHEGEHDSEGISTYLKRIGAKNLRKVIETIRYPEEIHRRLTGSLREETH